MGEEAVRLAKAVEQPFSLTIALMRLGVLYCRQGMLQRAISVLERSLALCQTPHFPIFFPRQALALAEELSLRPLVAHCHHGLGRLFSQTGRGEEARAELAAAIALYRAMDMAFWLPQAEAALSQLA